MAEILTDIELRVLGALVEKQLTTPEYYPLTLNALTAACNQKNNRYPVTSYNENEVSAAVETLREKNLVYVFYGSTSRVPKYKHVVPEVLHLTPPETAIVCVLMLRGPQTPGEVRGNASRFYEFSSLEEVEQTLARLENVPTYQPGPARYHTNYPVSWSCSLYLARPASRTRCRRPSRRRVLRSCHSSTVNVVCVCSIYAAIALTVGAS